MSEVSAHDLMKVSVPVGQSGSAVIDTFTISDQQSFASMLSHGTRYARPGRYTRLTVDGQLWMTDTDAEMSDHLAFVNHVVAARAGHILITGLGLGMVVQAMLLLPWMQRVDVIETDSDVIALVAGHYRDMAARVGVELRIHHGDAYSGVEHFDSAADRFDAVWHDIWPTIGSRNVVGMDALIAHYAPLVSGRQMCWCEDECRDFIAYLMAT